LLILIMTAKAKSMSPKDDQHFLRRYQWSEERFQAV